MPFEPQSPRPGQPVRDRAGEKAPGRKPSPALAHAGRRAGATPMMAQYLAIKRAHPDCLLFIRMGDFYELFFDDAATAATALDITLTRRGRHEGEDVPMCGVPVHSADMYLERLTRQGFKVAICEQLEDPSEARKRGPKELVRRQVVRVVTPGTLTEDTLLDARRHNYLTALARAGGELALAWADISTGEFAVQTISQAALGADLARLEPSEILVPDKLLEDPSLFDTFGEWKAGLTPQPAARFDSVNGERRLKELYRVAALDAFGPFTRAEIAALGALVDYVELTQKGRLPRLVPPRRVRTAAVMGIDGATRRNLELAASLSGERFGSLLGVIDRTVTGGGARLLAGRLASPSTDPAEINRRLDMVQLFVDEPAVRASVRVCLGRCPDVERALSRLVLGRGGPRDLAAIRDGLAETASLKGALAGASLGSLAEGLAALVEDLGFHDTLVDRLKRALKADLPVLARDGGFIAPGYASELDELALLRDESRRLIMQLQLRYRNETGVASLKVRHNNVLGYYIEVTPAQTDKLPDRFIHRQTLAGAVRFTTVELGELEGKITSAEEKALALELKLFDDLVGEAVARADAIARAARAVAGLDFAAALADLAVERRYCRPVVDDSLAFRVTGGRHPVVEVTAALQGGPEGGFVGNDCDLDRGRRVWLVSGPNMAGKSTFLRQNALIAILAQMGSFVPADTAHIGVVDRLFSRVGAADDLARGRSTFMVEMVETAAILNQAGERALVILDEIGRGTATFDGLSIAWAAVEHLHEVNLCRALFATHYHELTTLAAKLPALACYTMRVREWRGEVVFLYQVVPGAADRSYGIHVARLAGLPQGVVARAEQVLKTLERGEGGNALVRLADDLPLFADARTAAPEPQASPVETALAEVEADDLSPRAALDLVYRLRGLLKGKGT